MVVETTFSAANDTKVVTVVTTLSFQCTRTIYQLENFNKLIYHIGMLIKSLFVPTVPLPVKETNKYGIQGAVSIRKTVLPGMAIPMLKIRRPNGRLIFNMEIAIRK